MSYGQQPDHNYSFDPRAVPEDQREDTFAPAPPGWYAAEIVESEVRQSQSGGQYLKFQWRITGPTHANKRVWQNITTRNDNAKAVEIGQGQLYRLTMALGLFNGWRSTSELHGRPCEIKIVIRQQEGYEPQNEVREVRSLAAPTPQDYAPPRGRRAAAADNGYQTGPAPTPPASAYDGDDMPF